MSEELEKFNNFKTFLLKNEHISHQYKQALNLCPYDLFLGAIKGHKDKGLTKDDIIKIACEKASIDMSVISSDNYIKFTRYINFFIEIC